MKKSDVKVVILCGGEGTRLREETEYKPKPMVTIGNLPILWHIMERYARHGFDDFVLCLGYKGEMIKQFFMSYELMHNDTTIRLSDRSRDIIHKPAGAEDWSITFADTGLGAMTGARIKKIERYVGSDHFLATYGDGLSDIDIGKEIEFHRKKGVAVTLAGVHPYSKFGLIETDENCIIKSFIEKPRLYDYVNGGYYVFNKEIFDYVEADDGCVLEAEPFVRLAAERKMAVYKHEGFWHSMDTYKDFLELNKMWDSGKRPWKA